MRWEEIKILIESNGVKDEDEIAWITIIENMPEEESVLKGLKVTKNSRNEWEVDCD